MCLVVGQTDRPPGRCHKSWLVRWSPSPSQWSRTPGRSEPKPAGARRKHPAAQAVEGCLLGLAHRMQIEVAERERHEVARINTIRRRDPPRSDPDNAARTRQKHLLAQANRAVQRSDTTWLVISPAASRPQPWRARSMSEVAQAAKVGRASLYQGAERRRKPVLRADAQRHLRAGLRARGQARQPARRGSREEDARAECRGRAG